MKGSMMKRSFFLVCAAMALPGPIMAGGVLQAEEGFPQKVLYAKGGATARSAANSPWWRSTTAGRPWAATPSSG